MNETFYKVGGPVFLCIGGEGPPLEPNVVVTGDVHCADMVQAGARLNALLLALDHRFYSALPDSSPAPDLTTASLRLLSSRQAVADISTFVDYSAARFRLPEATKWVAFGGSYPGMLAAWAREKLPHAIHAAVASSAPVKAILNFQGYNDVVAASLASPAVGGDALCVGAVRAAFADLGAELTSADGRRALELVFPVCSPDGALEGGLPWRIPGPRRRWLRISRSSFRSKPTTPRATPPPPATSPAPAPSCAATRTLLRLAALAKLQLDGGCVGAGGAAAAAELRNTTLEGGGARVWLWQTCTEVGFYQTCDPASQCPFMWSPHLNNLSAALTQCAIAFGDDIAADTPRAVAATNSLYGAGRPGACRVLYVNGRIDPWSAASVQSSDESGNPVLWVAGASHHFWTHPPQETDAREVVAAREAIYAQVAAWLTVEGPSSPEQPQKCSRAAAAVTGVNIALLVVNLAAGAYLLHRHRLGRRSQAVPARGGLTAPLLPGEQA